MSGQTPKIKIMKAWRLPSEIVEAIERGASEHQFPDETSYVEEIFRRVFGLPGPPKPKAPRIPKQALELRA